jgi:glycyl-tRNA synthetase beta chain
MTATKKNLLVELFVEELPPKALKTLGKAFADGVAAALQRQQLVAAGAERCAYASPRRLAVWLPAVAERAADRAERVKLMPVAVGLDANGGATPALRKKLAALGLDESVVARLKRQPDGKAEVLFFDSTVRGATLAEGLQAALDEALAKLPIPKVMTYQLADGWSNVRFVRPAHGLVALHGAEVVPVTTLGLEAGRTTRGHRFEAAKPVIELRDADAYADQLRDEGAVIASFAERRAEIARQLQAAAAAAGGTPVADAALLDEVTALVERPNVLVGQFDADFLSVPQECLILTMKANQRYFPLLDAAGKLTHRFLVVSNIRPADPSAVIGGNERVVRPRLADARFFYDQDRRKTLADRVEGLARVVYHARLGTQGERVERVRAIAREIAQQLGDAALVGGSTGAATLAAQADRAALLAKADLLTDMVGEFPELQGTMGRYYALHDGEDTAVAQAIEDHYRPRFAGDALPRGEVGLAVALADKLETLAGLFGIGQVPTGDKDPFALRRHALGVIRMLIERELPLETAALVSLAFRAFPASHGQAQAELALFLRERLAGWLREAGYSVQEVEAVVEARPAHWAEFPKRLAAVRAFQALPEAAALAAANKRIGNILKKSDAPAGAFTAAALVEPAERELHAAMERAGTVARGHFDRADYTQALRELAALRAPVDAFFDGVMVNADDAALRNNRLWLLQTLHTEMNRVADLSRLVQ